MATTKQYKIEIELSSAQQALDKATAKLERLQTQLNGLGELDKNGSFGAAISKQMAATSAEIDKLDVKMTGLEAKLGEVGAAAPGSVGALRQEVVQLEAALETGVIGSQELAQTIQRLGEKRSALRALSNELNGLNPRAQARAFGVFAGALTGVVTIATSAAQAFGLSSESAQEYAAKMQGLVGVLLSVEQINKLLNKENQALIGSIWQGAKAWLGFGVAAEGAAVAEAEAGVAGTAAGTAIKTALISTGVGALIVLLGTLVSLLMDVGTTAKSSESNFTKYKATVTGVFDGLITLVKDYLTWCYQVTTFDWSGAAKTAEQAGQDIAGSYAKGRQGVIDEALRKEAEADAKHYENLLKIEQAAGRDTENMERELLRTKALAQKKGSDEQQAAIAELAAFNKAATKRSDDEEKASRLVHINALIAANQARGASAFAQELARKKEEQLQLMDAEMTGQRVTAGQKEALQSEIDALEIGHAKELDDKHRALLSARLDAQLVLLQTGWSQRLGVLQSQGRDEVALELATNMQEQRIAEQHRANLLAQAQVDAAAVVAADAQLEKLRLDRSWLFAKQRVVQAQEAAQLLAKAREVILGSAERREAEHQAQVVQAQRSGAAVTKRVAEQLAGELESQRMLDAQRADVGGTLLIRYFGVQPNQVEKTKQLIADFVEQASALVNNLMSTAADAADARLAETQANLQAVTDQLSQAQAASESTASKLETASGARRDYLLKQLVTQRAEEAKLAAQKAAASKAEAQAEKEKNQLTKESTQLTLASGLASTVATGAKSVETAVDVIDGAAKLPFPANIVAIGTGLAVVVAALAQARALSKTFADGGVVDGPSHAYGGIQMWQRGTGAHLGEMEGGEMVVNKRATANNLGLLQLINDAGRTRVLPAPVGYFASGGLVGTSGGVGPGQVVVQVADLNELLDTNRAMLSHLQSINGATTATAGYGPARLQIGPGEAVGIEQQRQQAVQAEQHASL